MSLAGSQAETTTPSHAWLNGRVVPWADCVLHARTQGALFGANVFEGVRGYWLEDSSQLMLFRSDRHLLRLAQSMKIVGLCVPFTLAEIEVAMIDLLSALDCRKDVHLFVVAYFGFGVALDPLEPTDDSGVHITAVTRPRSPGVNRGIAVCTSSWRRLGDDTMPPRVKAGANYQNSRLAHAEAKRNGYDSALLLNGRGTVAEAPASCVVMVRDGTLITPPVTSGIVESITRATLLELGERELGLAVEEREIDRTELYVADELFLCGTAIEVLPVTSVDRVPVGAGHAGPVTQDLQKTFFGVVGGSDAQYRSWLTPVYEAGRDVDRPLTSTASGG